MKPENEINRIIVRQLQLHKLPYEVDLDPDQKNQEVVYCYDRRLNKHGLFEKCSDEEFILLFTALIGMKPLHWDIAFEIAEYLPEKGSLIQDILWLDDCIADPLRGFNQLLLAYLGCNQKYETEVIKLLDIIPEDARDGLFLACFHLNTPLIFRKLIEKFTQWINADPYYGIGSGEGKFLKKFIVLWHKTQDLKTVNEFTAFCRKNWHYGQEVKYG